jgi:chromosome partitioning protein
MALLETCDVRTLAIANQKGGSAKTTTAVNLAAALGERGCRVLVLDLDPQASASHWYGITDTGRGLFEVFVEHGTLEPLVQPTAAQGVDLVPASTWLVGVDKTLAGEIGAETLLRRHLEALPADRWAYVLVDCPPTLGLLTVNALAAVQAVLVPVETHVMALQGLAQLLQTVDIIKARLNPALAIAGILACRVNARTRHAQEVVEELRRRFGPLVYQAVIRENVRLAECPSFGCPITHYDPRSTGAEDYRALAAEVLQRQGDLLYGQAPHDRHQPPRRRRS